MTNDRRAEPTDLNWQDTLLAGGQSGVEAELRTRIAKLEYELQKALPWLQRALRVAHHQDHLNMTVHSKRQYHEIADLCDRIIQLEVK